MKKLMGAAIAAGASMAGAGIAHADVTANIGLTSDYVYRGISLSAGDPAIQGGFDWNDNGFYAGVWASSLGHDPTTSLETDVYGGWTPSTGPVSWDVGIVGYFYPDADDAAAEYDYFEGKLAASVNPITPLTVGAALYYTPQNWGETGNAEYYEVNATYAFNDMWKMSGAIGSQTIDDVDGPGGLNRGDTYVTWNVGATVAWQGFQLDLRYSDTDIDASDPIAQSGYATTQISGSRGIFTISREL